MKVYKSSILFVLPVATTAFAPHTYQSKFDSSLSVTNNSRINAPQAEKSKEAEKFGLSQPIAQANLPLMKKSGPTPNKTATPLQSTVSNAEAVKRGFEQSEEAYQAYKGEFVKYTEEKEAQQNQNGVMTVFHVHEHLHRHVHEHKHSHEHKH